MKNNLIRGILLGAALWLVCISSATAGSTNSFAVDTTRGVFLLNGKPFQIISGEMHYERIPSEYWKDRLEMARAMGLNTVSTYVFWNVEEPEPGKFHFKGSGDVARFVRMAGSLGLKVILRPGPYACAEWDFGGFPAWLLRDSGMVVRSMDPRFIDAAKTYLMHLGRQLTPLQITHGGPIIMVQVENEYGSYGSDMVYKEKIKDLIREAGFDVPLFTADGPAEMAAGHIPGVLPAVNGATGEEIFKSVKKFLPNGPFFVPEYYPGWLDHWGEPHSHVDASIVAKDVNWMLAHGVSFNLYMFHGGTNFGFMNGANYSNHYQPQPTSYDYDAPLDEAGRPTPKYYKLRALIARCLPKGKSVPPVPRCNPIIGIPQIRLNSSSSLFDILPKGVTSHTPLPMEDLGQSYGYILYSTVIRGAKAGELVIDSLRDYAVVTVDEKIVGHLDRRLHQDSLRLTVPHGKARLDILVENCGRINYGQKLVDNRKGILGAVKFNGAEVFGWRDYPLPFKTVPQIVAEAHSKTGALCLYSGAFKLDKTGDTFLDMEKWEKGCVFVNGHNLGRYWQIGPQQTLYLPGVWLRKGINKITVFEMEKKGPSEISGVKSPILDHLEPESKQ